MSETPAVEQTETDHPLTGKVRLHMDFAEPHHLASFVRLARGSGLFADTVEAVVATDADSAEASDVHHHFLLVPVARPEHGARITDLFPLPEEPAAPPVETSGPPPGPALREGGTVAPY